MKKTNLIKVLAIVLVMLLILPVVVSAFETEEYTIEIDENVFTNNEKSEDSYVFSDDSDKNGIMIITLNNEENFDEETFYTDEERYENMCTLIDSMIGSINAEVTANESGEYDGMTLNGAVIDNDISKRVKNFTKNNYKANYVSGGFALTEVATGEDTFYKIELYETLHEDKIYTIVAMYEVGGDFENEVKDAINTFTFKTTEEEPVEEEPVEEEDNTKKDGKIAQAGVKVSFEGVAITMLAVCGLLLIVNNKRK